MIKLNEEITYKPNFGAYKTTNVYCYDYIWNGNVLQVIDKNTKTVKGIVTKSSYPTILFSTHTTTPIRWESGRILYEFEVPNAVIIKTKKEQNGQV